jgi:hypothetical protein
VVADENELAATFGNRDEDVRLDGLGSLVYDAEAEAAAREERSSSRRACTTDNVYP